MIPVNIKQGNIEIRNIEHEDIDSVIECVNESLESCQVLGRVSRFSYRDVEERYMETLISSLEFFCKVYVDGQFAGIIKGRLENKSSVELWILSFILLERYRNKGIGTRVISYIEDYFASGCSARDFYVIVTRENKSGRSFWTSKGYGAARIAKNIFENQGGTMIYEKTKRA